MTGTEKELILLGLFLIVAVNEDSAVVSGAILSYKHIFPAWQPFVACFLGMWMSDFAVYAVSRFGGQQIARVPLDAQIRFTRKGATRINIVRKIWRVRHGLQPLRVGNPNRSSGGLRSP